MKAHPVKGAAIMETIPQLADIIPGMKYHHEKWEGGGYPDGLKGEQIPLQARIVAVADAFDAMTTTRPYQKAMEVSYVLERLRGHVGNPVRRPRRRGARPLARPGRSDPDGVGARGGARGGRSMRAASRRAVATLVAALSVLGAAACQPKKAKTSAEVLLTERMGQVLLREGRPGEAEKAFRDVLKDDPKNPEVQDGLGISLLMQSRFQEALPYLDKAVDLAPNNASYRNNRGVAYMELGKYKEAGADFDAAEQSVNPDDRVAATVNRGRLYQRQGQYAAAEAAFSTALARDPQSFGAMFGRAAARESSGDLEGAAEDYLSAIKLNPQSAEANLRLGLCLVTLHKPDLGRRYLQRAVDLDPTGDTGAKARLASRQLEKRDVAAAERPDRPDIFPLPNERRDAVRRQARAFRLLREGAPRALHDAHRDPREARNGRQEEPRHRRVGARIPRGGPALGRRRRRDGGGSDRRRPRAGVGLGAQGPGIRPDAAFRRNGEAPLVRAAPRAPNGRAALRDLPRGRQRLGQDHDDREARRPARRPPAAASCWPPPTRSARAPSSSSRRGPTASSFRSSGTARAPTPRPSSSTPCPPRRRAGARTLLVDTAGRLHTKKNLMDELAKMRRIAAREVAGGAARDAPRSRRDDRHQRPRPGPPLRRGRRSDGRRADEARRQRPRRHRSRDLPRAEAPRRLRGRRGEQSTISSPSTRPTTRRRFSRTMPPIDLAWLDRAFALAERGRYSTSPNPMVGAVVVAGGRVVGEGFHRRAGGPHAEILALRRAGRAARGADLYLTLEPCVHAGRTPPCAPVVAASGVQRVIVAAKDPNPKVSGRGAAALRRAGIEVVPAPGPWRRWRARAEREVPGLGLDGPAVRPRQVGGDPRREDGRGLGGEPLDHGRGRPASARCSWREEYDAVLVGAGTVLADDPRLTRRLGRNRSTEQWRIVLDGRLRVPERAKVFRPPGPPHRRDRGPPGAPEGRAAPGARRRGLEPARRLSAAGWTCAHCSPSSVHGR